MTTTYVQLYTPCILEIGKQSMEGVDEMKSSETGEGRWVMKEFMTDDVKAFLKELEADEKAQRKQQAVTA